MVIDVIENKLLEDSSILSEILNDLYDYGNIEKDNYKVVEGDLKNKIQLRDYQIRSLQNLFFLTDNDSKLKKFAFHMATGSGKTILMAAAISYYYKQGFRKVLFLVNSTNIITKTKDNFLNKNSSKYLFNNDKEFELVEVEHFDKFQNQNNNISIIFSSLKKLEELTQNRTKEGSITYDQFEDEKILIISDEAHHLNANTKKGLDTNDNDNTWESIVETIADKNNESLLLEFTATIDFSNENIFKKYKNRIIYDYSIFNFRKARYSKDIDMLKTNFDGDNILKSIAFSFILNEFRKFIFENNSIIKKPIVLVKSKTIKESKELLHKVSDFIEGLKYEEYIDFIDDLENIEDSRFKDYGLKDAMGKHEIYSTFKKEFTNKNFLDVNSTDDLNVQKNLIDIDNYDNNYRVVFAVDKLNEGWDVISLYDIVRAYNSQQTKSTTMQECQLIGRGARYNPFNYIDENGDELDSQRRKFDNDLKNPLRLCETMIYYCKNDNEYINSIKDVLISEGWEDPVESIVNLNLKETFKKSKIFKDSYINTNSRVQILNDQKADIDIFFSDTMDISPFQLKDLEYTNIEKTEIVEIEKYSKNKLSKIISRDFLLSELYRNLNFKISNYDSFDNITQAADKILNKNIKYLSKFDINKAAVAKMVVEDFVSKTKPVLKHIVSEGYDSKIYFKNVLRDKSVKVKISADPSEKKKSELSNEGTYAQTNLDGNSLEWQLLREYAEYYKDQIFLNNPEILEVWLIRNDSGIKFYREVMNEDTNKMEILGFEPDFILSYRTNEKIVNILIEPKGEHLIKKDSWKQDLLLELNEKANKKDENIFTIGMPFFRSEHNEEFEKYFKLIFNI